MENFDLSQIYEEITKKKSLRGIQKELVEDTLLKVLKTYPTIDLSDKINRKIIIKEVRSRLRRLTGQFHKEEIHMPKSFSKEDVTSLLKSHSSTAERMESYPQIIQQIKKISPKTILDIGCGLNPLALALELKAVKYFALDIRTDELIVVKRFFDDLGIDGETITKDIRSVSVAELPPIDLCLLWKVLDLVDSKGHKTAEKIIDALNCEYMMISFSSKTLSGKPMNHPQRGWIERLLGRKGHRFESFVTKNEIFYIVRLAKD